jgi:hypothetical protein
MGRKITISTRSYEASHRRKPRGRGLWMFAMTTPDGRSGQFSGHGTYTDALGMARAYAIREGADTIEVMP